jgi:hypothetical protein
VTPNEPGRRTNFTWQNVLDTITALQAVRETPVLVWANPSVTFDVSDNTMASRSQAQGCLFLRNSRMVIDSVGVITIEEVLSGLDDRYQVARATSQTWQQCLDVINALKAMNQVPVWCGRIPRWRSMYPTTRCRTARRRRGASSSEITG